MKIINKNEFVSPSYTLKGNASGTREERDEFLNSLLNNWRADKFLKDNFQMYMNNNSEDMGITTKYLRQFIQKKNERLKGKRIKKVLKESEYSTEIICGNGKRVLGTLRKIIPLSESLAKQNELNNSVSLLLERFRLKELEDLKADEDQKVRDEQNKIIHEQEYTIEFSCKECGKFMKFPTLQNIDERNESFVNAIYQVLWNDIMEGNKLCPACEKVARENGNWKLKNIAEDIHNCILDNPEKSDIVFEINFIEFCKEYRFDKKIGSAEQIKKVVKESLSEAGIFGDIKFHEQNEEGMVCGIYGISPSIPLI